MDLEGFRPKYNHFKYNPMIILASESIFLIEIFYLFRSILFSYVHFRYCKVSRLPLHRFLKMYKFVSYRRSAIFFNVKEPN